MDELCVGQRKITEYTGKKITLTELNHWAHAATQDDGLDYESRMIASFLMHIGADYVEQLTPGPMIERLAKLDFGLGLEVATTAMNLIQPEQNA